MNLSFRKYTKELRNIRLQRNEHAALRAELIAFLASHPAPAGHTFAKMMQRFALHKSLMIGSLVLLVAISGTGMSYAAERSLPGTILYPLKIDVLEPLRGAVAVTPEAKVQWEVTKVSRRLSEAEQMLEQGSLNDDISTDLAEQVQDHSTAITESITSLQADDKLAAAADVTTAFTSTLQTHHSLLTQLAAKQDDDHQPTQLITTIELQTEDLNDDGNTIADEVASSTNDISHTAATDMQADAAAKIAQLHTLFAAGLSSFDASTQSQITEYLGQLDALMAQGQASLDAHAPADAFLLFQEAQRKVQDAEALLNAHTNLKGHIQIKFKRAEDASVGTTSPTSTLSFTVIGPDSSIADQSESQQNGNTSGDSGENGHIRNPRLQGLLRKKPHIDDLEIEVGNDN